MKFKDLSLNKIADVAELVHAADCKSADERSNRSFGSVSLKFKLSSLKTVVILESSNFKLKTEV
jgi:hypothetical protein